MNWATRREDVTGGVRFVLSRGEQLASTADVLTALAGDAAFRGWFNDLLADVPFAAFRWETPGVTSATAARPFEFVVLDAPHLARDPDPGAFAEHFRKEPGAEAVTFANLSGDSILVVPTPVAERAAYGHLAAFVRGAPAPQRDAVWKLVAETVLRRLGAGPVWLSTAGAGVPWLHVRLDDRPKYYGHAPYKVVPST